ncbi:hypothetical protein PR048_008612 [Dryococelus australis]|uniref:Uncharacterized protein n=1 Tax=Dryococelus australis TaxID=614101 RepID=A0ABQ9HZD0_9NEOP|nr:hypothetical protein PR048_008612 [Dryococelus australis]
MPAWIDFASFHDGGRNRMQHLFICDAPYFDQYRLIHRQLHIGLRNIRRLHLFLGPQWCSGQTTLLPPRKPDSIPDFLTRSFRREAVRTDGSLWQLREVLEERDSGELPVRENSLEFNRQLHVGRRVGHNSRTLVGTSSATRALRQFKSLRVAATVLLTRVEVSPLSHLHISGLRVVRPRHPGFFYFRLLPANPARLPKMRTGFDLGGVAPGFSHVGIVPYEAAGRWVSSEVSCFPCPFTPALLYNHLTSPSSALKTSTLSRLNLILVLQLAHLKELQERASCLATISMGFHDEILTDGRKEVATQLNILVSQIEICSEKENSKILPHPYVMPEAVSSRAGSVDRTLPLCHLPWRLVGCGKTTRSAYSCRPISARYLLSSPHAYWLAVGGLCCCWFFCNNLTQSLVSSFTVLTHSVLLSMIKDMFYKKDIRELLPRTSATRRDDVRQSPHVNLLANDNPIMSILSQHIVANQTQGRASRSQSVHGMSKKPPRSFISAHSTYILGRNQQVGRLTEDVKAYPIVRDYFVWSSQKLVGPRWSSGQTTHLPPKWDRLLFPAGSRPNFYNLRIVGRLVFSGISHYPPPLHFGAAPYSTRFTPTGRQGHDVKSTTQITPLRSRQSGVSATSASNNGPRQSGCVTSTMSGHSRTRRPYRALALVAVSTVRPFPICWVGLFDLRAPGLGDSPLERGVAPDMSDRHQTRMFHSLLFDRHTNCAFILSWATLAERLAYLPPTNAIRVQPPGGSLRIFTRGNRDGRCRWSAGFLGDLPFPPSFHSGTAPYS